MPGPRVVPRLGKRGLPATDAYINKLLGYSPTFYLPLNESTGTTAVCQVNAAQNSTYSSDVSMWPTSTGIGDGNTAPTFDGANDNIDVFSAALNALWDNDEFSIGVWIRAADAAVWTTDYLRIFANFVDGNNSVEILRNNVNGELRLSREGNNQFRRAEWGTGSPVTWFHLGFTVSKTADEHKGYQGGIQQGGTQTVPQFFIGGPLSAFARIGSTGGGGSKWRGGIAHFAYWATTILTQPQMLDLATV